MTTGTVLAAACGAAMKYAFHRPALDKAGITLLGKGALYASAGFITAYAICLLGGYVGRVLDGDSRQNEFQDIGALGGYALGSVIFAVTSKHFLDSVELPVSYKEAFATVALANFAGIFTIGE